METVKPGYTSSMLLLGKNSGLEMEVWSFVVLLKLVHQRTSYTVEADMGTRAWRWLD